VLALREDRLDVEEALTEEKRLCDVLKRDGDMSAKKEKTLQVHSWCCNTVSACLAQAWSGGFRLVSSIIIFLLYCHRHLSRLLTRRSAFSSLRSKANSTSFIRSCRSSSIRSCFSVGQPNSSIPAYRALSSQMFGVLVSRRAFVLTRTAL
jgi:hypothetical protein